MIAVITPVPVFKGLTVAGNVLDRDEQGEVCQTLVIDTTWPEVTGYVYELR